VRHARLEIFKVNSPLASPLRVKRDRETERQRDRDRQQGSKTEMGSVLKRALHIRKRALCLHKRALYVRKVLQRATECRNYLYTGAPHFHDQNNVLRLGMNACPSRNSQKSTCYSLYHIKLSRNSQSQLGTHLKM